MGNCKKETIRTRRPYRVGENKDVSIFPHRLDAIYENYDVTGRYYVLQDTYDERQNCTFQTAIANNLTLKEARDLVKKLIAAAEQTSEGERNA